MYNIESCIINEIGICSLVKGNLGCMDAEVHARLKYNDWWLRIIDEAKELFLCYCYIQKHNLGIPNVDRSHYEFLDNKTGFKRTDGAFESYREQLSKDFPDAQREIENLRSDFRNRFGLHYEIIICGKFLLSSLHDYLYTIINRSIPKKDIIWCLVNSFDLSKLDNVKRACLGHI